VLGPDKKITDRTLRKNACTRGWGGDLTPTERGPATVTPLKLVIKREFGAVQTNLRHAPPTLSRDSCIIFFQSGAPWQGVDLETNLWASRGRGQEGFTGCDRHRVKRAPAIACKGNVGWGLTKNHRRNFIENVCTRGWGRFNTHRTKRGSATATPLKLAIKSGFGAKSQTKPFSLQCT
jgi:hypothetical protein